MGRGRRRAVPLTEFDNFSESKVEDSSFKFKLDSPSLRNAKDSLQMVFPVIAEEKEETSNTGSSPNLISDSIQKPHLPFAVTLQVPSNYDNKHKLSDETRATSPGKTTENHTNKTNITSDLELEDIQTPHKPTRKKISANPVEDGCDSNRSKDQFSKENIGTVCEELVKKSRIFERYLAKHQKKSSNQDDREDQQQEKLDHRLVVSDTEADNKKNIDRRYKENSQSFGI